jgi:hypothetical protein
MSFAILRSRQYANRTSKNPSGSRNEPDSGCVISVDPGLFPPARSGVKGPRPPVPLRGGVPRARAFVEAVGGLGMDANSGEPWSEMDVEDLRHSLDYGNTFAATARFLCRDEDEVRQKARALGLTEHPGKRIRVVR